MALGTGNLNSCQRCWKHLLKLRPPQLGGSKTQTFISPKRDKPEAFCSWTSRCEGRGSGQHLGTWKAGGRPGIRAGSEGEKQSIKDTGISAFKGTSNPFLLPIEPVALAWPGPSPLAQQVAISLNAPFTPRPAWDCIPSTVHGPASPFYWNQTSCLLSETFLSSVHCTMGPGF